MGSFDPTKHLIQLKGKWYLETKWRINWFRQPDEHPHGAIATEVVSTDPILVKATIYDSEGCVLATAHAGAVDKGNAVWSGKSIEKAETAAIGRALGHAGYGTQFTGAEDADRSRDASGNWRDDRRERAEQSNGTPQGDRNRAQDKQHLNGSDQPNRVTTETKPAPAVGNDWNAIFKAVQRHFGEPDEAGQRAHFKNLVSELRKNGLREFATDEEIIAAININRRNEGKADKGWWNDKTTVADLSADIYAEFDITLPDALAELNQTMADFSSPISLKGAVSDLVHFKTI